MPEDIPRNEGYFPDPMTLAFARIILLSVCSASLCVLGSCGRDEKSDPRQEAPPQSPSFLPPTIELTRLPEGQSEAEWKKSMSKYDGQVVRFLGHFSSLSPIRSDPNVFCLF